MLPVSRTRRWATALLATVWLLNGLGAKLLGLVPRHRDIVARFVGDASALSLTRLIGLGEISMAIWIASGRSRRACAATQLVVIATMNVLELVWAHDLLLFPVLMPVANAALLGLAFWWSQPGRDNPATMTA